MLPPELQLASLSSFARRNANVNLRSCEVICKICPSCRMTGPIRVRQAPAQVQLNDRHAAPPPPLRRRTAPRASPRRRAQPGGDGGAARHLGQLSVAARERRPAADPRGAPPRSAARLSRRDSPRSRAPTPRARLSSLQRRAGRSAARRPRRRPRRSPALAEQQPLDRRPLHRASTARCARAEERLQMVDETMASGAGGRQLPWEEVRDWFHDAGNYIDPLDRARRGAGGNARSPGRSRRGGAGRAPGDARPRHRRRAGRARPCARSIAARGTLAINGALPPESRRFLIAHQLAAIEFEADDRGDRRRRDRAQRRGAQPARGSASPIMRRARCSCPMPASAPPRATLRHDIDRLCRRFGVSFEQACHRLSTLQRPGARGHPLLLLPGRHGRQHHQAPFGDPPPVRPLRRRLPVVDRP